VPRAFSNTDALGRLESHLSEGSQAPSRNPVSRMSGEIEATSRRLTFPDHIERDMSKSLPSRQGTGLSSATGRSISSTSFDDYTVGWICALSVELAAAIAMLDERHPELSLHRGDDNPYFYGSIGHHKVVIGCLPAGMTGNNSAASVATGMARSFPNLSIRVMVGIGGGIPSVRDIRLGDVVVSKPGNHHGGVVQYDFGKTTMGGKFEKIGSLPPPPSKLLHAIARLEALRVIDGSKMSEYLKVFDTEHRRKEYSSPGRMRDVLFKADYNHVQGEATCDRCDPNRVEDRADRDSLVPFVHYGAIASGNQVMRDALSRDVLGKQFDVLCFEMEAAGLVNMGAFPCLVIRGICDYADTHKNKEWQGYAAATAAAYAKEVLMNIPPSHNHG
jgi:nucleoside phosphorylase